jgi:hypothetical protein
MKSPSNLEIIYAAANRLEDGLSKEYSEETKEIILTAFQVGLLSQPKLIEQIRSSSLLEIDYFDDLEEGTQPTKISKKNYSITVRKGRAKRSS